MIRPRQRPAGLSALRSLELALWVVVGLAVLVYLLRAPLWNDSIAGVRLGEGADMLAIGAPSLQCKSAAGLTQCETLLADEALHVKFAKLPTLTCVASYGGREVGCRASYVYAPRLKPIALLPQLRSAAPPFWSWSGLLVWVDGVLALRTGVFVLFLSLAMTLLVGYRVARHSHKSQLRRYSRAAALWALAWSLAVGSFLISLVVLGYED